MSNEILWSIRPSTSSPSEAWLSIEVKDEACFGRYQSLARDLPSTSRYDLAPTGAIRFRIHVTWIENEKEKRSVSRWWQERDQRDVDEEFRQHDGEARPWSGSWVVGSADKLREERKTME